jgi:hypothetical protein
MNNTSQLDKLVSFLEKALPNLLPGEKIRVEDGIVYGAGDSVTIQETEIERNTIVGPKKFPGWTVSVIHYIPSTQWEPADCDEHEIGAYPSWFQAAEAFLVEIFRDKIRREEERQSDIEFYIKID